MPRSPKDRSPQAERIFQLRKSVLKLDQESFALRLDVKQATVSRWESGEITPSRAMYRELARLAPARSELQRQLLVDGGFPNVSRRIREINHEGDHLPAKISEVGWDPELMSIVIEALNKKMGVQVGELSAREYAEKIIVWYEALHNMKRDERERFLKTA